MSEATFQSGTGNPGRIVTLEKSPGTGPGLGATGAEKVRCEQERVLEEEGGLALTDSAVIEDTPAVADPISGGLDTVPEPIDRVDASTEPPRSEVWREEMLRHIETWDISKLFDSALELAQLIKRGVDSQEAMDSFYDQFLSFLGPTNQVDKPARALSKKKKKGSDRRTYKRFLYSRVQDLFKKDPALLAKHIRTGVDHAVSSPAYELDRNDVTDLYTHLWGAEGRLRLEDLPSRS